MMLRYRTPNGRQWRDQCSSRPECRQRRVLSIRSSAEPASQESRDGAEADSPEVSVRRRPPLGYDTIGLCGASVGYKVGNLPEINQPRSLLEEIVWFKAKEVESWRDKQPLAMLQMRARKTDPARDFKAALLQKAQETGKPVVIPEIRKADGADQEHDPVALARQYEAAGAACLSIVTDERYLRGSYSHITQIKAAGVACPLLCRDFVVEAYQLFKARACGADAMLLMAAVLPNQDLKYFLKVARALGMCCVIQLGSEEELGRVLQLEGLEQHLLAINNNDPAMPEEGLATTQRLMNSPAGQQLKQRGLAVVVEGGISAAEDVAVLQAAGVAAILGGQDQGGLAAGVEQRLTLQ